MESGISRCKLIRIEATPSDAALQAFTRPLRPLPPVHPRLPPPGNVRRVLQNQAVGGDFPVGVVHDSGGAGVEDAEEAPGLFAGVADDGVPVLDPALVAVLGPEVVVAAVVVQAHELDGRTV